MENIDKIYELLDSIEVTKENSIEIANIRQLLAKKNFLEALSRMRELKDKEEKAKIEEQQFLLTVALWLSTRLSRSARV